MPKISKGQSVLDRLRAARAETDKLIGIVRKEFLYERPIPERHRIIFYIGHLEAFDWNMLQGPLALNNFQEHFDQLFAFGIDPIEGELPTDSSVQWPSLNCVHIYREQVREALDSALELTVQGEASPLIEFLLNIAIEHRLMHAETLAYMFHQMPAEQKRSAVMHPEDHSNYRFVPEKIYVPEGPVSLGLSPDSPDFGWDNEFGIQLSMVPHFTIDKYKVTNQQFRHFIEAGGYEDESLWTVTDWQWRTVHGISHPVYWMQRGNDWAWRSMFGEIPLPDHWPVYVSHAEASAYARWIGGSLPSEAQWHRAAYATRDGKEREYPWGDDQPMEPDEDVFDPWPVYKCPQAPSAWGVEGMMANGWEWTSSLFEPFPGFHSFDFYTGYSRPFFDGKHFVLKGGSVRTAGRMLRRTFRNWFQPHYQYAYSGFRCVYENVWGH